MEDFKMEQLIEGGRARYLFSGAITEYSQFTAPTCDGVTHAVFDFSGIHFINSVGIQRWIRFISGFPESIAIEFVKCPARIINQINTFPAFLGKRKVNVATFYAPYVCSACNESVSVLMASDDCKPGFLKFDVPESACPKCGNRLAFDGIERKFFLFLKRRHT